MFINIQRKVSNKMNTLKESSSNNPKNKKLTVWVSKFSWLLFLKWTISFQGFGWEFELQYQPFLENGIFTELVQNLNPTDESIR